MLSSFGRLFSLVITMGAELQGLFVSPAFMVLVESCLVFLFFSSKQGQKKQNELFNLAVAEF